MELGGVLLVLLLTLTLDCLLQARKPVDHLTRLDGRRRLRRGQRDGESGVGALERWVVQQMWDGVARCWPARDGVPLAAHVLDAVRAEVDEPQRLVAAAVALEPRGVSIDGSAPALKWRLVGVNLVRDVRLLRWVDYVPGGRGGAR